VGIAYLNHCTGSHPLVHLRPQTNHTTMASSVLKIQGARRLVPKYTLSSINLNNFKINLNSYLFKFTTINSSMFQSLIQSYI